MRLQHLKDLLSPAIGEVASSLSSTLIKLGNKMLAGDIPPAVCPYVYGATLTPLLKKDGGIPPIAFGNTIKRLMVVSNRVHDAIGEELRPHQMGYGTPTGAETIVHVVRNFVTTSTPHLKVLCKLDFKNAFNELDRSRMLKICQKELPLYANYI